MAKRFTATEKWDKEWFMDLSCRHKCFWAYICENCDAAGIWEPNWKLASVRIGEKVTEKDLVAFAGRIERLANGKLFLPSFIEFQYGKLSAACKPHTKALAALSKAGIDYTPEQGVMPKARQGQVSESRRKKVYERDGGKCVYCGASDELVPDHIIPCAKGGTDRPSNLVTACVSCNQSKRDRSVDEFLVGNARIEEIKGYLGRVMETSPNLPNPTIGRDKEEEEDKEQDKDRDDEVTEKKGAEPEIEDQIYAAYPRRVGRPNAIQKLKAALRSPPLLTDPAEWPRELLRRTLRYAEVRGTSEPNLIPHPATWFNQERYNDDPETWKHSSQNGASHINNYPENRFTALTPGTPAAPEKTGRV